MKLSTFLTTCCISPATILLILLGLNNASSQIIEEPLLDEIERAGFLFFWEQADPITGQVKDRSLSGGNPDPRNMSSIAATGFGLATLAMAHNRGYANRYLIEQRVLNTLRFIKNNMTNVNGWYYHFIDMYTGVRWETIELSSIDTALLMGGVVTVGQYFKDIPEIVSLSKELYEAVDFVWMMNGTEFITMGWTPERGFIDDSWNRYCELLVLLVLAIGSPTHPIPINSWNVFSRPNFTYMEHNYIHFPTPLFVHQYSHAFIDFENLRDNFTIDYFQNSVTATRATKDFFVHEMSQVYNDYTENFWGVTASDTPYGYDAWGGPPLMGQIDGSIVPCAAAGSVPFLPAETIAVLKNIRENHTAQGWTRYGFVDAFNPLTNWTNPDVIGIDVGITVLMAENYRTKFVWQNFMANQHIADAMNKIGFVPYVPTK
ncbi:uncharacterized protein LOC110857227 [Folsomia candida]|uniref:uncharacterized protein LOC110857227 n=1 Tax=Folsomia candida TaxID=158441 RepID=UPI000B90433B|nr:uncharacterized protein LOC110857227 [Folsomia candida]